MINEVRKPNMVRKKSKNTPSKINWHATLVELAVVVIGITLAFIINRTYEDYKNRQQEAEYLQSLRDDLTTDIHELDSLRTYLEKQKNTLTRFSERLFDGDKISPDSLRSYVLAMTRLYLFTPQRTTFFALKSSGDLNLIRDYTLRHDIFKYYQELEGLEYLHRIINNYFNTYIISMVISHVSLKGNDIRDAGYFRSLPFKNVVLGFQSLISQEGTTYKKLRGLALNIRNKIEQNFGE